MTSLCLPTISLTISARTWAKRPRNWIRKSGISCSTTCGEGNVRELRNVIERAVIFSKGRIIGTDLIPPEISGCQQFGEGIIPIEQIWEQGQSIETAMNRVEAGIIQEALLRCDDNKTRAARMLGISRFALSRRLERLEKNRNASSQQ